jgi:hypothetical protein
MGEIMEMYQKRYPYVYTTFGKLCGKIPNGIILESVESSKSSVWVLKI